MRADGFYLVCARREKSPSISSLGEPCGYTALWARERRNSPRRSGGRMRTTRRTLPPRSSKWLELTGRFITVCLMRGSPTDAIPEQEVPIMQTIWGLLDHDLPHAGELSLLLGADGPPGVEMSLAWCSGPPAAVADRPRGPAHTSESPMPAS